MLMSCFGAARRALATAMLMCDAPTAPMLISGGERAAARGPGVLKRWLAALLGGRGVCCAVPLARCGKIGLLLLWLHFCRPA